MRKKKEKPLRYTKTAEKWYQEHKGSIDWSITENRENFRKTEVWAKFSRKLRDTRGCCEICGSRGRLTTHHTDQVNYDFLDPSKFFVLCLHDHRKVDSFSTRKDLSTVPKLYQKFLCINSMNNMTKTKRDRINEKLLWVVESDEIGEYDKIRKKYKFSGINRVVGVMKIPKNCDQSLIQTTIKGFHLILIRDDISKEESLLQVLEFEELRIQRLRNLINVESIPSE
jgi:hypothetical protein